MAGDARRTGRQIRARALCAVLAATLPLTACNNGPSEAELRAQEESERRAQEEQRQAALLEQQKDCMIAASNGTIFKNQSNAEMDVSFSGQDLTNCPDDFVQRFVALGNAVHQYVSTTNEIRSHSEGYDAAVGSAAFVTLIDLFNGKPSGATPYSDWRNDGTELEQRAANFRRNVEDETSGLKVVLAKYGLAVQRKNDASPTGGATNPAEDAAVPMGPPH